MGARRHRFHGGAKRRGRPIIRSGRSAKTQRAKTDVGAPLQMIKQRLGKLDPVFIAGSAAGQRSAFEALAQRPVMLDRMSGGRDGKTRTSIEQRLRSGHRLRRRELSCCFAFGRTPTPVRPPVVRAALALAPLPRHRCKGVMAELPARWFPKPYVLVTIRAPTSDSQTLRAGLCRSNHLS